MPSMDDIEDARRWLRMHLDASGSVSPANQSIAFHSGRAQVIDDIKRYLVTIGITPREYAHPGTRRIVVKRRSDVLRFIDEVGSGEPKKRAAMETIRAYRPKTPVGRPPKR